MKEPKTTFIKVREAYDMVVNGKPSPTTTIYQRKRTNGVCVYFGCEEEAKGYAMCKKHRKRDNARKMNWKKKTQKE